MSYWAIRVCKTLITGSNPVDASENDHELILVIVFFCLSTRNQIDETSFKVYTV